jgi:uncharacterized protein YkwD
MTTSSYRPRFMTRTGFVRLFDWKWVAGMSVVFGLCTLACAPQQAMELQLTTGINQLRVERQLEPLPVDPVLSSVARARAEDMALKLYFSHQPPDGCDYRCLLAKQGFAVAWAGEIIAWNTSRLAQAAPLSVEMWRTSSAHYAIIISCHFARMGTGAAIGADGRTYHVAVFEGDTPGCVSEHLAGS